MKSEEHDDLWELLGKSKQAIPSPFLARNILREIKFQQGRPSPTLAEQAWALFKKWRLATLSATAVALLAVNLMRFTPHAKSQPDVAQISTTSPDYEVIVHLDELLASQENSLWTDTSPD